MKLTKNEEEVIVQHILKLNERAYPPRLSDVEDMANSLLAERYQDLLARTGLATLLGVG
jgi:hypothetical protein